MYLVVRPRRFLSVRRGLKLPTASRFEAQAEAVGTVKPTLNGTWANPLAAETTVGIALGGTSPTVTEAGRVDILIEYKKA